MGGVGSGMDDRDIWFTIALRCLDPGCLAGVIVWGALCLVNLSTLMFSGQGSGKSRQRVDDIL